jgi:hypothetical protein
VRAHQGYVTYTGSYGATAYDASATQVGNVSFDHIVGFQGVVGIASGSAAASFLAGAYMSGLHAGSGVVTNAYGYYWGGWSGAGTVTNKWAFFSASSEANYFGGNVYCNAKLSVGTGTVGQTLTINSAGNVIFEVQQAGVTIGYLANGSAIFGGATASDFAFNAASAGKKVIIGNAGVRGIEVVDGVANCPGTTDASAIGTATFTVQGGGSFAKSLWIGGTAGNFLNVANATGGYRINNTQVVGPQITGYGVPTGNSRLSAFPGATATLAQCSAQIAQMIIDFKTHGLLGA